MTEQDVLAMFLLANIKVLKTYQIANMYWPDNDHYAQLRRDNPWWLVQTPSGMVRIGRRKRVISINWEDTPVRKIVTSNDVTKDEHMVHAWTNAEALAYLSILSTLLNKGSAPMIRGLEHQKDFTWQGPGEQPAKWTAEDGTVVYRSYSDYVMD